MTTMTRIRNAWRGLMQADREDVITIEGKALTVEQIRILAQQGRLELREIQGGTYLETHGETADI